MKNKLTIILFIFIILFTFSGDTIFSCTNILVSRGASTDGSTFISYAADSHVLYGELYHWPARDYPEGAKLDVYEWDTGKYLGKIDQVRHTYNVVGNMNQFQVSIGETTYGGRRELKNKKGIIDYGSAMFIALQRSKTAREAIKVITGLFDKYGYYSSGESFSISDPREVWILEVIGKGPGKLGTNWVARRIPEGYISAHANQARIRKFPLNDPKNCLYGKDTISFAREKGYFKGEDKDFSFTDAYAPLSYGALRFCEARVWSIFRRVAESKNLLIDYVKGVEGAEPLPLFIKPDKKLSVRDVMELMRDHFEGTEFDMTKDIGAGPFKLPYRWRGLTWKVDDVRYCNERAVSTQQTGFSFVSQSRSWLPDPIGGIHWFGVDDSYSTCYIPMYSSMTSIPKSFAVGTGSFEEFTWDSAFWVFNFVSNFAYSRYSDMIKDIRKLQGEMESSFIGETKKIEKKALSIYKKDPEQAVKLLTGYSVESGEKITKRWMKLGESLLFKYLDGNVKNEDGKVTHPGYPKEWYKKIVKETGDHFKVKRMKSEVALYFENYMKRGDKELKNRKFTSALKAYEAALKLKPENSNLKKKIKAVKEMIKDVDAMIKNIE
ncbi:MAG: C69 family dipeptidase [Acidobacteriota bacterium]